MNRTFASAIQGLLRKYGEGTCKMCPCFRTGLGNMEKERVKCVPVLGLALDVALVFVTWLTVSAMRWSRQKGAVWQWGQHVPCWLPLSSCCTLMAVLVGAELPNGLCLLQSCDPSSSVASPVFCPVQFCFHLMCGPVLYGSGGSMSPAGCLSHLAALWWLCLLELSSQMACVCSSHVTRPVLWPAQSSVQSSFASILCVVRSSVVSGPDLCPVLWSVQSCVWFCLVIGTILSLVQSCDLSSHVPGPVLCYVQSCVRFSLAFSAWSSLVSCPVLSPDQSCVHTCLLPVLCYVQSCVRFSLVFSAVLCLV